MYKNSSSFKQTNKQHVPSFSANSNHEFGFHS